MTDHKIITEIAKETKISINQIEKILTLQNKVLLEILNRGINIDLGSIQFNVIKDARGVLRKQRIGDQKAIIDCIRNDKKIHLERKQTINKINKLNNEAKSERIVP